MGQVDQVDQVLKRKTDSKVKGSKEYWQFNKLGDGQNSSPSLEKNILRLILQKFQKDPLGFLSQHFPSFRRLTQLLQYLSSPDSLSRRGDQSSQTDKPSMNKHKAKSKKKHKPTQPDDQSDFRNYKPEIIEHVFVPHLAKHHPSVYQRVKKRISYYKKNRARLTYNICNFSRIVRASGEDFVELFRDSLIGLDEYAQKMDWSDSKRTKTKTYFKQCLGSLTKLKELKKQKFSDQEIKGCWSEGEE